MEMKIVKLTQHRPPKLEIAEKATSLNTFLSKTIALIFVCENGKLKTS